MISAPKRILSFFAHPDDEVLSAGGTFAKLSDEGVEIAVAIPATGIHSRRGTQSDPEERSQALEQLRKDTQVALEHVGVRAENIFFGEFSDNEIDAHSRLELIHWLESLLRDVKPDCVFTHHLFCTNVDHRRCHEAAVVATRPGAGSRVSLVSGEVPSSTGYMRPARWEPNWYVELTAGQVERKIAAMECYESERREAPHPRSPEVLRALATVRGSESGVSFAEAFMIQRAFG